MKPRYWVEKTLVAGRVDRETGPHALGLALWSPQQSASSGDIYRLMREVQAGDRVFHLIDNDRIEGVSIAAAPADDSFVGLERTDWAGRPGYRVPLKDFARLSPALRREEFLEDAEAQPVLRALLPSHQVFYNRGLNLRQGAYLTEAPPELVRLWNRLYRSKTGHDLPHVDLSALDGESPAAVLPREDLRAIVEDFARQLISCGIGFGSRTQEIARTFVASLATKRFVILTGLSGSGKTQIALQLGHWFGPGRYAVVPVRPDWTGAEAVFGYEDALREPVEGRRAWYVPYPLEFMLKAGRDPSRPYLLVLDEMNLAHVERYLADLLSGMESRLATLPNLIQGDGDWRLEKGGPQKLTIPSNLFLVGTVNVDETTYMFSPKVLDRANTIDFRVETDELSADARQASVCGEGPPDLVRGFLEIARDGEWQRKHPSPGRIEFVEKMLLLHRLLTEGGFEFGHRILFESVRFASMLASAGEPNPEVALDHQVIQKILPRLHGSRRRLEPTLSGLGRFCLDLSFEPSTDDVRDAQRFDPLDAKHRDPRLPRSFEKIRRMTRNLRANQFTSFTE